MNDLTIFTDGAYSSKLQQGGVGVLLIEGDKKKDYSNKYSRTSNNQMELAAVIIALRFVNKEYDSITIYSDSKYVIGCATLGWQRKANKLLWKEYDKQYERVSKLCSDIKFVHIRGHQKDDSETTKWNNYVDKLAQKASNWV